MIFNCYINFAHTHRNPYYIHITLPRSYKAHGPELQPKATLLPVARTGLKSLHPQDASHQPESLGKATVGGLPEVEMEIDGFMKFYENRDGQIISDDALRPHVFSKGPDHCSQFRGCSWSLNGQPGDVFRITFLPQNGAISEAFNFNHGIHRCEVNVSFILADAVKNRQACQSGKGSLGP